MFERRLPTTTHSSFAAASAFFPVRRSESDGSPRTIRQANGVLLTSMKTDALTAYLTTNQLYVRRCLFVLRSSSRTECVVFIAASMNAGDWRLWDTDANPVQPRAEIVLHLADQVAGEGPEVAHLGGILGDDEAEMMPVVEAASRQGHGAVRSSVAPNMQPFSPSRVTPSRFRELRKFG
jgi:hypothetical protein